MSQQWDEIASAYLDGDASPDEVARLEADVEGQAALAELRRVADANAAVPPPPPGLAALHLGNALDLFDELGGSSTSTDDDDALPAASSAPSTNVVPLRRRRAATWLATAAAGLVVVAGVGIGISGLGGSGDDASETASASSSSASAERLGADDSEEATESTSAMAAVEADVGDSMADDEGSQGMEEEAGAAVDDSAVTPVTPEMSTTAPATVETAEGDLQPVAELTTGDDLFAVAEALTADDQMSGDPATEVGAMVEALQVRCPAAFEGFDLPVGAPIIFDGSPATLVTSTSPTNRAMVITRACAVLFADQQP